ncbi:unnamed protein product [Somion occarium]|uniref:Protein kinase domain-containing protein n=1 Tax=Somion occarium TaxID=3059160 RepID=A0ABP1DXG9_9APHY
MIPPQPPQDATDIFSITDQVLADRLHFIEEIGFGNWGSVWLCRPKPDPSSSTDLPNATNDSRIAVKLVHRSKTSTTAARVRSLWNEMKVVRSFKHEPHPSIIPFYSFIITPSYALITMAYHPKLVPVEVSEHHAKEWFRSLLSGIEFLHKRGVVHNDIKPANILLSAENVPVLVDFGFAERYDMSVSTAFHSNLSYGTPEYLSPERARGLQHDTRKSDVWSLGVTFFEILIGRTPFEYEEGEQFSSKEDLEKYWARTMRGKWVGTYKMSKHIEKLLKRMILPNADLRCTATQAIEDAYWTSPPPPPPRSHAHKKSASVSQVLSTSLTANINPDVSMLLDTIPPWNGRPANSSINASDKENKQDVHGHKRTKSKIPVMVDKENGPPGLIIGQGRTKGKESKSKHVRSQSQPKLQLADNVKATSKSRKHIVLPSLLATLSPIKHSPPPSNTFSSPPQPPNNENLSSSLSQAVNTSDINSTRSKPNHSRGASMNVKPSRKPLGPRQPTPPGSPRNTATSKESKDALAWLNFNSISHADLSSSLRIDGGKNEDSAEKSGTARSRDSAKDKDKETGSKRRRSNMFMDLAGSARNVDLSAHTLPPVPKKENARKEKSARVREINLSQDKENSPSPVGAHVFSSKAGPSANVANSNGDKKGSVRDRMREWERDRERLREMQRLEERLREAEEERNDQAERERLEAEQLQREIEAIEREQREREERERQEREEQEAREAERKRKEDEMMQEIELARAREAERVRDIELPSVPPTPAPEIGYSGPHTLSPVIEVTESFDSRFLDVYPRSGNESGLSVLKSSLNNALDKTVRLYKSSTHALSRSTNALDVSGSVFIEAEGNSRQSASASESLSWEGDVSRESRSSLPVVRQVARTEQVAAENQLDRMTLWIKSVEKVVEDARQTFAASAPGSHLLPPLPVAPVSRNPRPDSQNLNKSQRSSRVPRKILAANQIFVNEFESGEVSPSFTSDYFSSAPPSAALNGTFAINETLPTIPSEMNSPAPICETPATPPRTRARRATVVTKSPEVKANRPSLEIEIGDSPSKRKEKSKSQNDLCRPITPIAKLEFEIERFAAGLSQPAPTHRLSAIVDKKVFIADRSATNLGITDSPERPIKRKHDDLTASPLHVDPYPPRPQSTNLDLALDTPAKKHIEGVYDRFLMSTTGVKRNGKGYQSDNVGPVGNIAQPKCASQRKKENFFLSTRKPMPPPVSSEDLHKSTSVDEFGALSSSACVTGSSGKADGAHSVSIVRRALRTIVNGKR